MAVVDLGEPPDYPKLRQRIMANSTTRTVFLTGSTGYIGSQLGRILLSRGHYVKALARFNTATISNLPRDSHPVFGDAVNGGYESHVPPCDTFVHLVETTEGDASPLTRLAAFQVFQSGIRDRCAEPPLVRQATIVGNYRMLGES